MNNTIIFNKGESQRGRGEEEERKRENTEQVKNLEGVKRKERKRERERVEPSEINIFFTSSFQIGNIENHYRFQMLVNVNGTSAGSTYTKSADYRYIRSRNLGSFAEIGLQTTLTTKLQSENMVCINIITCVYVEIEQ